jgi:thioredoxin 1
MLRKITTLAAIFLTLALAEKADNKLDLNNRAREIDGLIDSASVRLNDGNLEASRDLVRVAKEHWGKYVEFHNYIADREFARLLQLDTLVNEISGRFEQTLEGDFRVNLPGLKERLKFLLIAADLPVLADFSGNTCKFCKIMKARLTAVAPDYMGKVRIVYINVNVERDLVKIFRVTLIPTLVFIGRDGKEVSRNIGAMEENDLRKKLNDLYSK